VAIPRLGDYRGPYGFVSVHEHSRRRLGTALRHNQVVWCFLFIAGPAPPSRSSTPR
jgi:hypothetical protein